MHAGGDSVLDEKIQKRFFGTSKSQHNEVFACDQYRLVKVPGDGNCLFASLAVANIVQKEKKVPSAERTVQLGISCRAGYLKRVLPRLKTNSAWLGGGPPIGLALRASSGLTPSEYEKCMARPNALDMQTWGGFFEAAFLGHVWQKTVKIFVVNPKDRSLSLMTKIGYQGTDGDSLESLCVVWTGTHFDALLLK